MYMWKNNTVYYYESMTKTKKYCDGKTDRMIKFYI